MNSNLQRAIENLNSQFGWKYVAASDFDGITFPEYAYTFDGAEPAQVKLVDGVWEAATGFDPIITLHVSADLAVQVAMERVNLL